MIAYGVIGAQSSGNGLHVGALNPSGFFAFYKSQSALQDTFNKLSVSMLQCDQPVYSPALLGYCPAGHSTPTV